MKSAFTPQDQRLLSGIYNKLCNINVKLNRIIEIIETLERMENTPETFKVAEQTEPQISPSDCATCKHDLWSTPRTCSKCVGQEDGKPSMYEPKDEPQTECLEQFRVGLEYHTDITHFGKTKGESVTTNKIEDEPQTERSSE